MKIFYKVILFLFAILFVSELSAQDPKTRAARKTRTDIYFGLNLSEFDVKATEDGKDGMIGNDYKKLKPGFQVAFYLSHKFYKDLQIQTGLVVTKKGLKKEQYSYGRVGGENEIEFHEYEIDKVTKIDAAYVQIPINIGWEHFFTDEFGLNINGGPFLAYGFKGRRIVEGKKKSYHDQVIIEDYNTGHHRTFKRNSLKKIDYGLNFSVGAIYDIFAFRIGYEHGLANVSDKPKEEFKTRNMYFAAGFRF